MDTRFKEVTGVIMQRRAFHRYEVWRDNEFVGETFQFVRDADTSSSRWMAQSPDGLVHGWLTTILTRKVAGQVLATYADRTVTLGRNR